MKKFLLPLLLVVCTWRGTSTLQAQSTYEPYRFTTFAGQAGVPGSLDGTGAAARFDGPRGLTVDSAGNIYVADLGNGKIRKITSAAVVTTVAVFLDTPLVFGIAVDSAGNLYVTDTANNNIRKVTPAGVVSNFAGSAASAGSADGTGAAARFWGPRGMAVDSADNIYVADLHNFTIRKITPAGAVSTLAGLPGDYGSADGQGSAARFTGPRNVAVDSAGNVYVADYLNANVRKITPNGLVSTLAGSAGNFGSADGAGGAARFGYLFGVAVDSAGNVYVGDFDNHTIRKISPAGDVRTLAGVPGVDGSADGTGSAARFNYPTGVAVDRAGNVYVGDSGNSTIRLGISTAATQLLNISTRLRVLTGERVLIGGFIVTGSDPKEVIIRGIGPSLSGVGVTLGDPTLELHKPDGSIITNDNWKINDQTGQSQEPDIRATTIPPTNDLESAIVATLNPGAYTAILAGKGQTTGVGLVEVYDLAQSASSKLANISTRGFVDTGDNVMIGGLIVGPNNGGSRGVIVRAIGPSLTQSGISDVLADPTLELHNGNGAMVISNDNWKTNDQTGQSQEAEIRATTIPPTNDLESAIVATLSPGPYTAIVAGKSGSIGVGLVEVYDLQ